MTEEENILSEAISNFTGAEYKGYSAHSSFHDIAVAPENIHAFLDFIFRENIFWCDHLISISGEHYGSEFGGIRLHYHVTSIIRGWNLHVFVQKELTDKQEVPDFESVSDIWKSANWHERETAELFGVHFKGHPDLRKLLLPANWEGFPLRKDYVPQEKYHGVIVKY
jgi:NADH-quinone oxidoreductase subunit C